MKSKLLVFVIAFIVLPCISFAAEPCSTALVDGQSYISVDGDFSDWSWMNVLPVDIAHLKEFQKVEIPVPDQDFSAVFQCVLDSEKLYLGFKVTDSHIVFGTTQSTSPFWDDAVELILFDCISSEKPETKIWVSADSDGSVKIQGREPESVSSNYPYLRQEWGVKAAIKMTAVGYNVELSIPRNTLSEFVRWSEGLPLKANVRAYNDNSSGKIIYLEWADNPLSVNSEYREIQFNESVSVSSIASEVQNSAVTSSQEFVIELGEPDISTDQSLLFLKDLENDLAIAKSFEKNKKYSWAIERHEKILKSSPPQNIKIQSELSIARNCYFMNDFSRAGQVCEQLLNYDIDAATQLKARMILLSIDRKENIDTIFAQEIE